MYQDVLFALRTLAKDRRFALAAVIALGLAIGVNNSVFKIINTATLRDLPFPDSDRLIAIRLSNARGPGGASYPDFVEWQKATRTLEGLAATINANLILSEQDRPPERLWGAYMSANAFRVLRTPPVLGRDFHQDDDRPGAPGVALIGYSLWQSRYGGDPAVLGRSVRINGQPATIVGVMPEGFRYPAINRVWQPLSAAAAVQKPTRTARPLAVFGRLADEAELASARAEFAMIAGQLAQQFPDTNKDLQVSVVSMREHYQRFAPMMLTFMGAAFFVLLVACANLANLLLARSIARSREIAIRASLGATRWRIVRQLLIECLIIAAVAGVLGALLSIYGANTLAVGLEPIEPGAVLGANRPFWVDLSMDRRTYLFIGVVCVFATLACGLIPALVASRTNVNDILKEGARGTGGGVRVRWWTSSFIVAEIALTLMLLSSAGLLWRSFLVRYQQDVVIDSSNLIRMTLGLPVQRYPTPELRQRFYDQLDARLTGIPAVAEATIASAAPLETGAMRELSIAGREDGDTRSTVMLVQTGERYFETVKLPVTHGRLFTPSDGLPGQEGAIVDERFASSFFPGGNSIGQRIRLAAASTPIGPAGEPSPWLTIVGIAASLPLSGPAEMQRPAVYVPMNALALQGPATILVRATDQRRAIAALRDEVRGLDADLPLYAIETVDTAIARSRVPVRLVGTWFGIFALIALLLAAIGLYAITAHGVTQRIQEIGVRMALGAKSSEVLWLFMRRSLVQLATGLTLGLAGALATGQLLQAYLTNVGPRDPLTLVTVALFLIVVAVIASVLPARRATRVDPVVALRYE